MTSIDETQAKPEPKTFRHGLFVVDGKQNTIAGHRYSKDRYQAPKEEDYHERGLRRLGDPYYHVRSF